VRDFTFPLHGNEARVDALEYDGGRGTVEGYELVTSDEHKVGHVVGTMGDSIVVEHGLLRKRRHAVPITFTTANDEAQVVRTTLSKEVIERSPHLDDDDVDEAEIAAYYGLAEGVEEPGTEGYGELESDETAITSDRQARSDGLTAAEEERAAIREDLASGEGRLDRGESPGITGDRFRDAGP
jgi:hypothetical protein